MSDKPNFNKLDEQEPVYAPQQVPGNERIEGNPDAADDTQGTTDNVDRVGVPAAGAGLLGMTGGGAGTSVQGGSPGAGHQAAGAAADEDATAADRPV